MFRPNHRLATLGSAFVLLASLVATGCEDEEIEKPRVIFTGDIKAGTHSREECGQSGIFFTIGSFGNRAIKEPERPVELDAPDQQGTVNMSCSVIAAGDGFNVAASVELTGATGGAVTIIGVVKPDVDNPNVRMSLSRKGETFADDNCTVRFDPAAGHAIAGGRIWANIDCPNARYERAQQMCATNAQFRLENCTQ